MINSIPAATPAFSYSSGSAAQVLKTNMPALSTTSIDPLTLAPANSGQDTVSLSSALLYCPQRPLLLMSDYDGTLHRVITNFRDSFLEPQQLETIRRVANQPDIFFCIISGRPMDQLLKIFSPLTGTPMFLLGSHGGEIYDLKNGIYLKQISQANKAIANNIENELLVRGVFNLPGIELESKEGSLTLHYDHATPQTVMLVKQEVLDTLKTRPEYQQQFTTRNGKNIIEVLPKEFNKGQAVLNLLPYAQQRFGPNIPIHTAYAGDDIADYDAMKVVHQLGGCTFLVSETPKQETNSFVTQRIPTSQHVFQYFRAMTN